MTDGSVNPNPEEAVTNSENVLAFRGGDRKFDQVDPVTGEVSIPDISNQLNDFNDLNLHVPNPEDDRISEHDFNTSIELAWQICDRFDLQTDIWRGRVLKAMRDREKVGGDGRGTGFLNWLKDHEITKSQAYALITLANSADSLLEAGSIEPESVNNFSKRAFVETAQASPEVQQMVGEAARSGDRITRREVKQLADEWTAMTSELLPENLRQKAAENIIPTRYLAPLAKEMAKLPEIHRTYLQEAISEDPDIDNLKQVTAEAKRLAKYLSATAELQAIADADFDLEVALDESLRLGYLKSTADLVSLAAQVEQTVAKLYTIWKRVNSLSDQLYVESGASTPHLRSLLKAIEGLSSNQIAVRLGAADAARTINMQISDDEGVI
ncbi:hypothetical protein Pse7367_1385 [Thalassoporum mexicanum PCC 7367]|uniref:hypothetical protein n=1 Tax=Thalassoporum mexicanum TaxID=3457544 RepID=UPI00029FF795|nr:hypothetical protein [Pseudanabaena sp. PCC 7367]AFY69677.1 hypothetical protein Pse7367_1385 [Pseudanabaena sp. PCC 7367]